MCRTEWSSKALNTGQNWTFVHLIDREHTMTGRISPLRQRMIDDMSLRNMSASTRTAYIRAVTKFSKYFGRSPDKLSFENVVSTTSLWSRAGSCGKR